MVTRVCAAVLVLILTAACGNDLSPDADSPATTSSAHNTADGSTRSTTEKPASSPTPAPGASGTRIVVADSDFGQMLFDATGQAIYLFDIETTSEPQCYGACAEAWPPVLTTGRPVDGRGVRASLLGTTKRTNGTVQVTYNDHPLYFYAHEGKHEVKCHNIFLNGGTWYVVQPGGAPAAS
jgi:predicted lipoprotein with Yx(FWY)xxD motif